MASSEGQTELLTGWSCVVHQPSEDPEPSELPSTVDITAFSAGLNVDTSINTQDEASESDSESESASNNSGSDGSGSCTQSDSSDTDSSSSSSTSRSPSPEFSVTSQPNGLRLTIATVRKSCSSPPPEKPSKPEKPISDKTAEKPIIKSSNLSSSSDSPCSDSDTDSNHDSDKSVKSVKKSNCKTSAGNENVKAKNRTLIEKKVEKKGSTVMVKKEGPSPKSCAKTKSRIKRKKMASLPASRSSTCSSSDSNDSDADSAMLASCSLQEIRQEDLAAILPDQQECDAFGAFEEEERNSPQTGDASGSDMELPQQALNALIQRTTESSSESESHPPPNPNTLYANSLIQQFVSQPQILKSTLDGTSGTNPLSVDVKSGNLENQESFKRKRGRPRKMPRCKVIVKKAEFCGDPNVSPDSGIQNSPDHVSSPESSPVSIMKRHHENKQKIVEKTESKQKTIDKPENKLNNVEKLKKDKQKALDKVKTKQKVNDVKTKNSEKSKNIDLSKNGTSNDKSKEHSKLAVTSNRFDRILYGNGDRVLYPPRRKAGRPPLQRKGPGRPPKYKNVKSDSNTSIIKPITKSESKNHKTKKLIPSKDKELIINTNKENKTNKAIHLNDICERVSKRLELSKSSDKTSNKDEDNQIKLKSNNSLNRIILGNKNKVIKSKSIALKAAKLMHSKHKHKKHKKCKFKIFKSLSSVIADPKLNTEIDKLVQDFEKFCYIDASKMSKENVPEMLKALKKVSKKRKTSDNLDRKKKKQNIINTITKEPSSNNEQRLPLKKRHYHLSNDTKPDSPKIVEQPEPEPESKNKTNKVISDKKLELPLNLSPKSTNKTNTSPRNINNNDYEVKNVDSHINEAIEACINKYSINDKKVIKTPDEKHTKQEDKVNNTPITTPKKRHRLEQISENSETPEDTNKNTSLENVVTEIKFKRNLSSKLESKKPDNTQINTRKKNRLEDLTSTLASKINPTEDILSKRKKEIKTEERATVIKYPVCKKAKPIEPAKLDLVVEEKPTGIFTPTVDLGLPLRETKEESTIKIEVVQEPDPVNKEKPKIVEVKKKPKKRRAFNRTGFPTVKKKKKKVPLEQVAEEKITPCDRVPEVGEEYSQFVERTKDGSDESTELLSVSKWEVMSECDSLPQDERIDFDSLDIKSDRMSLRNRDYSPLNRENTPDTRESDLDDISLDSRIELLKKVPQSKRKREVLERKCNENVQKKFRDVSPASSIDPYLERRLKEDRASASSDDSRKPKRNPRWRKKYLIAGLFSDYYKEGDVKVQQKRKEVITSKTKLIYNSSEHPFGLFPAPYHCGKYLRCRKIPFQLPFDLWWQHTHSQLPGRDAVPSWNYKKIRTNVYNVKNTTGACEPQACNCSSQSGCGDDCINRLVLAECPASHKCKNQKIQKHEWAPGIEKFMTENKGWGVRTNLPIKSGEFILEYVGEVVSDQEFKERMATRYIYDTHHYCLHLDGGLVIDGHRMGGEGRFVNHSCEPNCEMQKWSVNGQFRMALFALRDIKDGEEITYDYNFSLFNATEGQECKCGNDNCRGVIGGKSQRIRQATNVLPPSQPGRVGRPRKNQAKKAPSKGTKEVQTQHAQTLTISNTPQFKPLSHAQRLLILDRHVFLLRNIKKIKKNKDKSLPKVQLPVSTSTLSKTFQNHLNSLRLPRNIKTRRLAQAEEDPELKKTLKLSNTLRDIFKVLLDAKDDDNEKLCLPFMTCPSKRKVPDYYQKVSDPIDLTMIESKIDTGFYKTFETFDSDIIKLFTNVTKAHSRSSDIGVSSIKLKKVYDDVRKESHAKFENVLGIKTSSKMNNGKKKGEEEDIIRCICGMHKDEGLMIQCERCFVWQHCECIKADVNAPSYHCEKCVPREVDYEIPLDDYTEHGHQYYMTLMRDDLQLRQGDTVYVLRDIPIPGTDKKHTYDTIGEINYTDLDIFRIERLWKDCKTGKRFAYGHHFLRPHETYHEPTRKFFPNEVMRVPLYEAVPVELIISHCWVMDLNTFCKGRPIGAPKEHIYICEYRVDKSARLFSKVSKSKLPICTKSYAFDRYETRLKVTRTYTPHDLDPAFVKQRGRKPQDTEEVKEVVPVAPAPPVIRTLAEQKSRLNNILLNLLSKQPTKNVLDVSYLLEGGRRRKKQN